MEVERTYREVREKGGGSREREEVRKRRERTGKWTERKREKGSGSEESGSREKPGSGDMRSDLSGCGSSLNSESDPWEKRGEGWGVCVLMLSYLLILVVEFNSSRSGSSS